MTDIERATIKELRAEVLILQKQNKKLTNKLSLEWFAKKIYDSLIKISFKTNYGTGVRVCYPNELLAELFGKDILDKYYVQELGSKNE